MRRVAFLLVLAVLDAHALSAQRRSTPSRGAPPTPPAKAAPTSPSKKVAAEMTCPAPLGVGVNSKRTFCDVLTSRVPAEGILIDIPPHAGPVTLTFDLHNRHTYSEEQIRAKRAYARYTASIGALTLDNTLISRAAIQSEFRNAADLWDRIGGGAGPGGIKAVAPTGLEPISITVPAAEGRVSILGEKLTIDRLDSSATYSSSGRPIAIISNVMIEYRPAPAPAATRKPAR